MDDKTAVSVNNVSIRYKFGDFKDIGLKEWVVRHIKKQYRVEEFMAVRNVSFTIEKGDMLGIVGSNGSGKSTLLKAISGIMAPTEGEIEVKGSIAALLELVSGFDGNLSVKENAYLRGAMLGYTRKFMDEIYEQIIDFAELSQFCDRPFKQLSSGMQSRLAFAIASMVRPDVLILDEVLSVGDGAFQEKSASKMREIMSGGTTTILVSHSLAQIRELCNKVLWLNKGGQVDFGSCDEICDRYQYFLTRGEMTIPHSYQREKKKYDYLIVGAGLYGCVFAYMAVKAGKKCLVIDKRSHIGGNIYQEKIFGIDVHKYGPHIFHTSNRRVWDFVNQFVSFKPFFNSPLANYNGEIYNLPFNMNTFNQIFGVALPEEARSVIDKEINAENISEPKNLEEQALKTTGRTIYEKLIKGYTQKQWGRSCTEIPPSIISRVPLRFVYDNRYFDDIYQGIPAEGYNMLAEKLLEGSELLLDTDFKDFVGRNPDIAEKTVFTGRIDEYYDYSQGVLEYRSLRFEHEEIAVSDYQGNAVVNYTSEAVPFTRITEHKHFLEGTQPNTVITREYPVKCENGMDAYYPINDEKNSEVYRKYAEMAEKEPNVIFGGRLGEYKYCNMDEVILSALQRADIELKATPHN